MQKCPDCGCCCDYGRPCCGCRGGNIDHPGGCKKLPQGPYLPCGYFCCNVKPVRCGTCLFGSGV